MMCIFIKIFRLAPLAELDIKSINSNIQIIPLI